MKKYLSLFLVAFLAVLPVPPVAAASDAQAGASLQAERALLLKSWEQFCDDLKATGSRIVALDRGQALNTAEGFHYLAMLAGVAVERFQGYGVPTHPEVHRNLDSYKKMGLDSSDNSYRLVRFEPGGVYRIRGWRGDSSYLGFQLNQGISAVGNLHDGQMQFNADGSFEVYIGGKPREGNWMPLPAGADSMYIREIFIDWPSERASPLWIERLDMPGPPRPLDAATVAGRLGEMADFVSGQVEFWNRYVERAMGNTNRLPTPIGATAEGGSADNLYSGGYFRIAEDEALLIETDAVPARFWSVQLGNNWFQSLDYRYRQTSLNSHQARRDGDGKYRVVVAAVDPGFANWLDTAGHREGVIYYRWNMAEGVPGEPRVQVVKLSELDGLMAPDSARVTPAQRSDIIAGRARDVARRFAY